ncbi:ankyrin repeat-containing domain protein [Xylogone sp. PMI_703]|nr:ankyrin repeat-containing domain protein [Xylogone sp. PMI_703]
MNSRRQGGAWTKTPIVAQVGNPATDLAPGLLQAENQASLPVVFSATPDIAVSPPVKKNIWLEIWSQLSNNDKAVIQQHVPQISGNASSLLQSLVSAAQLQQKRCQRKNWKFSFGGREVNLQETAGDIVDLLEKVKDVGDIAVNVDPVHAGLPWAAVRLLLQVIISDREQMATLLFGLSRVISIISRYEIYEILYIHDAWLPQASEKLELALIDLHLLNLQFLVLAIRVFNRSKSSRILHALWTTEQISELDQKRQVLEKDVEIAAENCERLCSRSERANLKELLGELNEWKTSITRMDGRITALWTKLVEEERGEILRWTSNIPYEDHHLTAREGRTDGTGEWLLQRNEFRTWMVLDYISELNSDHILAYFYCNRNEDSRRDPDNILRSFVKQLAVSSNNFIQTPLVNIYKQEESKGFASSKLSPKESCDLLFEFAHSYSQTIIVLDALDEAYESERHRLLNIFDDLIEKSTGVKIFISSRHDDDIQNRLERRNNSSRSSSDKKNRRDPISEGLKTEIIQTILNKGGGMFQWAALQIDQAISLTREKDIRQRLGWLPKDLKAAYDEIWKQIETSEGRKSEIATRAFQWVMCVERPISAATLVAFVCQDPNSDIIQPVDININFVLDACRNLLVFDERENTCQFSHLSVREYFDGHWGSNQTNGMAAKLCLTYLLKEHARSALLKDSVSGYAVKYLLGHIQRYGDTGTDDRLSVLLKRFLGSVNETSPAYRAWVENYRLSSPYREYLSRETIAALHPVTLAPLPMCVFGFNNIISEWWQESDLNPETVNDNRQSLLVLAAIGGFTNIARRLIKLGANINRRLDHECFGSALVAAAYHNQTDMLEFLVKQGADINMQVGGLEYDTALEAATYPDNSDLIRVLIRLAAEFNIQIRFGNALAIAARSNLPDTMLLLVQSGADVNAQVSYQNCGSVLTLAALFRELSMVNMLIKLGANANAEVRIGIYGSALAAATCSRDKDIIKALIQAGADVNDRLSSGEYGSTLVAAALNDYTQMLNLANLGADVNIQLRYGPYGNALIAAVAERAFNSVEELAKLRADINTQVSYGLYPSALATAVYIKDIRMIMLLAELGVDINTQFSDSWEYGNALEASLYINDVNIARLLVDLGADTSTFPENFTKRYFKGKRDTAAVLVATEHGYLKALELLYNRKK